MKRNVLVLTLVFALLLNFGYSQETKANELGDCLQNETQEERLFCAIDLADRGILNESICIPLEGRNIPKQDCYDFVATMRIAACAMNEKATPKNCHSREIVKGKISEEFCSTLGRENQRGLCAIAFEENKFTYYFNRYLAYIAAIIVFFAALAIGTVYLRKRKLSNKGQSSLEYLLLLGAALIVSASVLALVFAVAEDSKDITEEELSYLEEMVNNRTNIYTGPECGNSICEGNESYLTCPEDCGLADDCGDGICQNGETPANCPPDCSEEAVCGDGICKGEETYINCSTDCEAPSVCGDGICGTNENETNCPQDCTSTDTCGNGTCEGTESYDSCPLDCNPSLTMIKEKTIADGARPEVVFFDNKLFVTYLSPTGDRKFDLKIFDEELNQIGIETLVEGDAVYGDPTDIRVIRDGINMIVFYELSNISANTASLFVLRYSLAEERVVTESITPIAQSVVWNNAQNGDELLADPAGVVFNGELFVMSLIRTGITPESDSLFRVRKISNNLQTVLETKELDLSNWLDGSASVNSLAVIDGTLYGIFTTTVHPQCGIGGGPDVADTDLALLEFDNSWKVVNKKMLVDDDRVTSGTTGFTSYGNFILASYQDKPKTWTCGGGVDYTPENVLLHMFDKGFSSIEEVTATDNGKHPAIAIGNNEIYLAYGEEIGEGFNKERNFVLKKYVLE